MYRQSLALTFRLYPYVLMAVIGELIVKTLEERDIIGGSGSGTAVTIMYVIVAFYAHLDILFPDSKNRAAAVIRLGGFLVRNLGLILLIVLPAAALAFSLYYSLEIHDTLDKDEAVGVLAFIILPLAGIFSLLVFGFMGTWLPAYVLDRERGVGKALARGKSTFLYVAGRLIIGPGLIFTLTIAAIFVSAMFLGGPEYYFEPNWTPNITTILVYAIGNCFLAWAIIMTAWIFSMAFLKTEADQAEEAA